MLKAEVHPNYHAKDSSVCLVHVTGGERIITAHMPRDTLRNLTGRGTEVALREAMCDEAFGARIAAMISKKSASKSVHGDPDHVVLEIDDLR